MASSGGSARGGTEEVFRHPAFEKKSVSANEGVHEDSCVLGADGAQLGCFTWRLTFGTLTGLSVLGLLETNVLSADMAWMTDSPSPILLSVLSH